MARNCLSKDLLVVSLRYEDKTPPEKYDLENVGHHFLSQTIQVTKPSITTTIVLLYHPEINQASHKHHKPN